MNGIDHILLSDAACLEPSFMHSRFQLVAHWCYGVRYVRSDLT